MEEKETIWFVCKNRSILNIFSRYLEELGYNVRNFFYCIDEDRYKEPTDRAVNDSILFYETYKIPSIVIYKGVIKEENTICGLITASFFDGVNHFVCEEKISEYGNYMRSLKTSIKKELEYTRKK